MKKIKILLIALILIVGASIYNQAYATGETRTLGAKLKRPFTNIEYKFRSGIEGADKVYTVVKIYDNEDKDEENNLLYNKALYCLRGGLGFGVSLDEEAEGNDFPPIEYKKIGEMHENAASIIAEYQTNYNVNLDRTETINDKEVNIYNAILWILDEAYLPKNIEKEIEGETKTVYNASEYKEELLTKIGVTEEVSDDDLEVVQQLAIWYFANYDEQSSGDSVSTNAISLRLSKDGSTNAPSNIDSLDKIYHYFVFNAIENSNIYQGTDSRNKYVGENKFDDSSELRIESIDYVETKPNIYNIDEYYYKIGPFKIQNDIGEGAGRETVDLTNVTLFDADGNTIKRFYVIPQEDEETGEITSAGLETIYSFVDSEGNKVTKLEKGIEYYIRFQKKYDKEFNLQGYTNIIPEEEKYDVSEVSLKLASTYSLSTATFLIRENADQPVVEIEKEKKYNSDELKVEKPKEFDLSLRKYITNIKRGETNLTFDSREPKINTNTLIDGIENRDGTTEYTATYTHPKNALEVQTGDIVTYTIRVYNEGELDGTATQIKDYLPEGLELIPASESTTNSTYGWTNPSGDGKTIVTDYLKDTTIKAFDKDKTTTELGWQKAETGVSGLYYADVQVECRVVATVGANDQSLRNIAAITDDNGDDRDSEPGDPGRNDYNPPADNSTYKEDDDDYEDLKLPGKRFDLALRKYITKVERDGEPVTIENARNTNNIDLTKLISGEKMTAEYKHRKDPVEVKQGDIVTYRFTVYNEGDVAGYVYSIVDYLPAGLEFDTTSNANYIQYKENYEDSELEGKDYIYKIEENKITITSVDSEYLFEKLDGFDGGDELDSDSLEIKLKVTANVTNKDQVLTNVATMTYGSEIEGFADRDSNRGGDDNLGEEFTIPTAAELVAPLPGYKGHSDNENDLSQTDYHYAGQQDDDDFEKIIIKGKEFDLSLRKYISAVNGKAPETSRVPQIDTSKLNTIDEVSGEKITTAIYKHSKEPLTVKKGDIVTYKIRIYNEGQQDGYATKVTDYLPEGLGFLWTTSGDINSDWFLPEGANATPLYGEKGIYSSEDKILKKDAYKEVFGEDVDLSKIQVVQGEKQEDETIKGLEVTAGGTRGTTQIKATDLIKAYGSEKEQGDLWQQSTNKTDDGLFYQELEITCIVLKENTYSGILKNVAEITEAEDANGNKMMNVGDDRDSEPNNVYADQNHTPKAEVNGYTAGEQDDDDFEPLQLKYFDLALRKFITGVETNGKTQNVTSRIPNPKVGEDGNIVYEHTKDPVYVANNDNVIYTIRVYNEGTIAGYAEEITDDIPEGLMYLPEHSINNQYEWKMYDKDGNVTENAEDAVTIKTDYLSQAKENKTEEANRRENLINPFDNSKEISTEEPFNPDYKEVKVAFKITEPNTSDRIITNSAQISKDSDDDIDSIPDEWNEGEDDQDKEHIYVKYFDLSLLKWVTKTVVTVDGKTTTTETGFKPNTGKTETTGIRDNKEAEPIAKVELDKKKLDKTTVKFVYKIRVTNEGEIEGYATEITDFIPTGLEFKEEDNKAFGWVKDGENKVKTRALETVLLKPGESKEVEIVFTWKNNANNLGLKTNIAEITEDYNEHSSKDIDSTPNNKKDPYEKEQEDDDDFALVILSLKTGKEVSYILLTTTMVALLAGGIYLVKRFVLTY